MGADRQPALPHGTVTLLFTDIEGSTDALRELGHDYQRSLAAHHRVIRDAIGRHRGAEVDTQGDGFFVAFPGVRDALDAAAEIQRQLAEASWAHGRPLRVRMGLHTGEPELTSTGYVGLDVNRASRICGVAHGGQVVVSAVTRALVRADDDVEFIDLGRHLLKDFDEPQRLFQLALPWSPQRFAPLRTVQETNLPTLPGRFVGREEELDVIGRALQSDGRRLVTLVGPGGSGKSRLALEVAQRSVGRWAHGVRLVRLAGLEDDSLLPSEITRALGLEVSGDVELELHEHLADRHLLLVVDNVEHLAGAPRLIASLAAAAPRLRILATSRGPLHVRGEHVVEVDPLPEGDAVALFIDRARAAAGRFVAEARSAHSIRVLCDRLDRLPLAIEIAAARVATLSVADMVDLFQPSLATRGPIDAPDRHRSLAATIGWSYDLLEPALRTLHGRLAVFQATFTPEMAREAFEARVSDLETLREASLLRRLDDVDGRTRLGLLRVIREFALTRLELDGGLIEARAARDGWIDRVVSRSAEQLEGPTAAIAFSTLVEILPDLRASLDESRTAGSADRVLRLVAPLERFWRAHGYVTEARDNLRWALDLGTEIDAELRARSMWALGRLAIAQGDTHAAAGALEQALVEYRRIGATREIVFAITELAWIALDRGAIDEAERRADEALELADAAADERARSSALSALASVATERGESARARRLAEQSLEIRRQLGDRLLIANATLTVGSAALAEGDLDGAEVALLECLAVARDLGDSQHEAAALCCLGEIAALRNETGAAFEPLLTALAAFIRLRNDPAAAECLVALAAVTVAEEPERARRLLGAAQQARTSAGVVPLPVERRLERRIIARLGENPSSTAWLSIVDAALLAGVDPAAI